MEIESKKSDSRQQISSIGTLERNKGTTIFVIIEKSEETILDFSQNFVTTAQNGNPKNCKFIKRLK